MVYYITLWLVGCFLTHVLFYYYLDEKTKDITTMDYIAGFFLWPILSIICLFVYLIESFFPDLLAVLKFFNPVEIARKSMIKYNKMTTYEKDTLEEEVRFITGIILVCVLLILFKYWMGE